MKYNIKKSNTYITPRLSRLLDAGIAHKYAKADITFPDTPENRAAYNAAMERLSAAYKIYNRNCDHLEEYDVFEWENSVCCHYSLTANDNKSVRAFERFLEYLVFLLPEDFPANITEYALAKVDENAAESLLTMERDKIDGKPARYADKDGEIRFINGQWGFLPKRWRTRWYTLSASNACLLAGLA